MDVIDEEVATDDLDQAERLLHRVYPVARIHESRRDFSFSQRVRGDDRAVLARFGISSWAQIHVDFDGTLGFGRLLGGSYRAASNGDEVDPGAPFLLRPGSARSQSERLDLLMVNLDQAALTRFAGEARGLEQARLRFPGVNPGTRAGALLWNRTVAYAHDAFESPDLLGSDLFRRSTVDMLFAAALTAFPIEVTGEPPLGGGARPPAIRRALTYIDEHLDQAIGVEDIAAAARLTVRGLQAAFRRHLDTTPRAALRAARLAAAHADLVAADPAWDDVAAVARRWGFHHLGRFAADHRAQYGELPRTTLQR